MPIILIKSKVKDKIMLSINSIYHMHLSFSALENGKPTFFQHPYLEGTVPSTGDTGTNKTQNLCFHQNMVWGIFSVLAILTSIKWYLLTVLIYISLINKE